MKCRIVLVVAVVALWLSGWTSLAGAQGVVHICNGVEATIVGTAGPDDLVGTPGPDVIAGLQGHDTIRGLGGDDIICGGRGADFIYGGDGFDIIFGAQGNDVIHAANGDSESERADVRGARIFGGAGNDWIVGSSRWDRIQGGPGQDLLYGNEGRDWIRGGPGEDLVNGGRGIDDLHGGNGWDKIKVYGSDVVRGGSGLDRCDVIGGAPESVISCGLNEREPAPRGSNDGLVASVDSCTADGTVAGTVDNNTASLIGVYITVDLFDGSGVKLGEAVTSVEHVVPSETVYWDALATFDTFSVASCVPRTSSFPGSAERPGEGIDASISFCGVAADGTPVVTSSITNYSREGIGELIVVYGYDGAGVRLTVPVVEWGAAIGIGRTGEITLMGDEKPSGGLSRCELWFDSGPSFDMH